MAIRVGINGFGRIGRTVVRIAKLRRHFDVVAVNDLAEPDELAYAFKYDSVHGRFKGEVAVDGSTLVVNGRRIRLTAEKDAAALKAKVKAIMEELAARDGGHDLQLAGAFVDGSDPRVAEVPFGGVVLHVAGSAQHLDRVLQHPHRQRLRCFKEHGIVQQVQRLQRRVRDRAVDAGQVRVGTVKSREVRMRCGPLEKRVHAAAIAVGAFAFGPGKCIGGSIK